MKNTKEWVASSPKSERQQHIRLDEECLYRGGNSTQHRGILVQYLDTDFPEGPGRILLAHACDHGKCSNPRHLYWATDYENTVEDAKLFGTWKTPWEKSVAKHGYEKACEMNGKGNKAAGGRATKGIPKSAEHKRKTSEALKAYHRNKTAPMAELADARDLKSRSYRSPGSNPGGGTI